MGSYIYHPDFECLRNLFVIGRSFYSLQEESRLKRCGLAQYFAWIRRLFTTCKVHLIAGGIFASELLSLVQKDDSRPKTLIFNP